MKEKLCSNYPDDIGYYSQQGSSQHEDKTSGSDCKDEDYVFKRHDVKLRTTKGQLCFPPSFYRIKYHKSQRKRH